MKLLYFTYFVGILFWLGGCDSFDEPIRERMPIVVEGWIEEGESPIVMVTHALDLSADSANFDDIVEKWGRVSVFDGDERYVLTGRLNKDYTPSFIFTTARLKGEAGHTYRLLIETETDTVEAFSTMPPSPLLKPLESIAVQGDSLYYIKAFADSLHEEGYYKFFVSRKGKDTRFFGSFLGTFQGADYDRDRGFVISNGKHSAFSGETTDHYFRSGETVSVKLCSMEGDIYDFWKAYDAQVAFSDNLFFTFEGRQPTNIAGGRGYWAAYGCASRLINIP